PHPRYIATDGMTAIAKALSTKLDINRSLRVVRLSANQAWTLICETGETFEARSIVLAIPAPQAVPLLESIEAPPADLLDQVRLAEFDPCLTVIATYPARYQAEVNALPWRAIEVRNDDFAWIGIDSSKRPKPAAPVIVIHSSLEFANRFLEAEDLQPIAKQLLDRASRLLPWLSQPETMQIHRWRYAFARRVLGFVPSAIDPLPIVCCGDWCMGANVEAALRSGEVAAVAMHELLEGCARQSVKRSLPALNFAEMMGAL
ncbi:MAG: FAD-dependent oxidoreductase, partial [Microcoleus sp. SIO2G3]|nr:FAD-dependent oxidoreductase [Microcoleus sp. SIO2G3]